MQFGGPASSSSSFCCCCSCWLGALVVVPPAKNSKILSLRRRLTLLPCNTNMPPVPPIPLPYFILLLLLSSPFSSLSLCSLHSHVGFLSCSFHLASIFGLDAPSKPACYVLKLVCNIFVSTKNEKKQKKNKKWNKKKFMLRFFCSSFFHSYVYFWSVENKP